MTPGIVDETLDGISYDIFIDISSQLKSGTFKFKPGKRIQIPKPNGKVRPLTIAPPRDKIVQEAIRMILNAIYEPVFLEHSHGFRPNRSCNTALKYIYAKFKPITWEGDFEKCFDIIDHKKLINLIKNKITDRKKKFTNLIQQSLEAGYF